MHQHSYRFQNLMSSWRVAPMKIKIQMGIWFFGILSTKVISGSILRKNLRFPQLFFGSVFKRKGISSPISQISQESRRVASFYSINLRCALSLTEVEQIPYPLKLEIIHGDGGIVNPFHGQGVVIL